MEYTIRNFQEWNEELLKYIWLNFVRDERGSDLNIIPSQENANIWLKSVRETIKNGEGNLKGVVVNKKSLDIFSMHGKLHHLNKDEKSC